ncbi:lasso peptide biosynthesis B2 protein [Sphingosinicella sp. BN140058]|uniref:lasso peptide biosynthesis B2 protein n=1 Tax=Sphingosinicella sp. BN140058 TaxID=1892855 RepID=UPI0010138D95|nr:lasso peptide biosynthesis B2 protein [Sphingosinicella sp. BN140058]
MTGERERSRGDRLLAIEATFFLLLSRYGLRLFGFRRLIFTLGAPGPCAPDPRVVARIAAAVDRGGARLGLTCLRRALAAAWMLRLRGLKPTLHYGVSRTSGAVQAHAWLEVQGLPVVGHDQASNFALLASFPGSSGPPLLRNPADRG